MAPDWQPIREPAHQALLRSGSIALLVGAVVALSWGGRSRALERWPLASLLALWFSLGGHWLELGFPNWLRPRLSRARPVQVAARLMVWLVGGAGLNLGMALAASTLGGVRLARWPAWYIGGLAFVARELAIHLWLQRRARPSFYNGRG